jgi:23S rRNA G2445 N2-methylase RlmL
VELRCLPLAQLDPKDAPGALLMNPPYGQRLERSAELERDVEEVLGRFGAQQRALIVPVDFPVQRPSSRWLSVFNGPIECELRRYDRAAPGSGSALPPPSAAEN